MTKSDEDPEDEGEPDESAVADHPAESPDTEGADTDKETAEKIPLSELREDVTGSESGDEPVGADQARDTDTAGATEDTDTTPDIPLSELRSDVVEDAGSPASDADLFFQEQVDEVESEAVWADLLMGSGDTDAVFDATAIEGELEREYQIVPKTLCHRCEYFGDPPTLHCTHEGTTIHETVDMDHYRVSECPMVRSEGDSAEE